MREHGSSQVLLCSPDSLRTTNSISELLPCYKFKIIFGVQESHKSRLSSVCQAVPHLAYGSSGQGREVTAGSPRRIVSQS